MWRSCPHSAISIALLSYVLFCYPSGGGVCLCCGASVVHSGPLPHRQAPAARCIIALSCTVAAAAVAVLLRGGCVPKRIRALLHVARRMRTAPYHQLPRPRWHCIE